jgi:hypothetical protein
MQKNACTSRATACFLLHKDPYNSRPKDPEGQWRTLSGGGCLKYKIVGQVKMQYEVGTYWYSRLAVWKQTRKKRTVQMFIFQYHQTTVQQAGMSK